MESNPSCASVLGDSFVDRKSGTLKAGAKTSLKDNLVGDVINTSDQD